MRFFPPCVLFSILPNVGVVGSVLTVPGQGSHVDRISWKRRNVLEKVKGARHLLP